MNIDLAAVAVQEVMESDVIQNMLSGMHLHLLLVYVTNVLLVELPVFGNSLILSNTTLFWDKHLLTFKINNNLNS